MPDDKDYDSLRFMDSPWVQLGVPLAAMAATAIAPRHAGPAARIGMYGFQGVNDMRQSQMRLKEINDKLQAEQAAIEKKRADTNALVDNYYSKDAESSGAPAPEGGQTVDATQAVQGNAINNGQGPITRFPNDPQEAAYAHALAQADPEAAIKWLGERASRRFQPSPEDLAKRFSQLGQQYPDVSITGAPSSAGSVGYNRTPLHFSQGSDKSGEHSYGQNPYTGQLESDLRIGDVKPSEESLPRVDRVEDPSGVTLVFTDKRSGEVLKTVQIGDGKDAMDFDQKAYMQARNIYFPGHDRFPLTQAMAVQYEADELAKKKAGTKVLYTQADDVKLPE